MRITHEWSDVHHHAKQHGRVRTTSEGLEMAWSGSGFTFSLSGCHKVVLRFAPLENNGNRTPVCVGVYVNGSKTKFCLEGTTPIIFVENDEEIETFTCLRLSEGDVPLLLQSFELWGDAPAFLPPPPAASKRILFIGDSITCGYGTESVKDDTVFYSWEEDVTHAYAYITAKALGADYQIVAISGQGIVLNCMGEVGRRFGDFWKNANRTPNPPQDESQFDPHIVVVNGGTNDRGGNVSFDTFYEGADHFLSAIREKHPKAEIIWIYGAMGTQYAEPLERLFANRRKTDAHMSFVCATPIYAHDERVGVHGHPTHLGQIHLAKELMAHIAGLGLEGGVS